MLINKHICKNTDRAVELCKQFSILEMEHIYKGWDPHILMKIMTQI